jgi:predicted ribosomally synthesized peptide with SipW-like signal peptide
MKKKLTLSVFCIAVAIAAMMGGTLAWFTDTDTTPTNTFKAGVLSLDVNDKFNFEDKTYDDFTPGDNVAKTVNATNDGTKREFVRVMITETRTLKLHYAGTALVEYLHSLDANNLSTKTPGIFAATLIGGQWVVDYNVDGNPVAFTGQPGRTGIYVTNLGGYDATSWSGQNGTTAPTYAPAMKLSNTSDPASALVAVPGSSIDVYRELPASQWFTTTTNDRDMADINWYTLGSTPFAAGLWTQKADHYWYFNQALYPAGYDGSPANGNDNPAFLATVAPLVSSVEFPSTARDNIYQGSVYTIDFTFETIQVTNGAAAAAWGHTFSDDLSTNLAPNVIGTWS